jgi:hypothetical protein
MRPRVSLLLAALALGCASVPRAHHTGERAAGLASPELDPAARGSPRHSLAANGLEHVTIRAAFSPRHLETLDLLGPDLSPAGAEEVRRAFPECPWTSREDRRTHVATYTLRHGQRE